PSTSYGDWSSDVCSSDLSPEQDRVSGVVVLFSMVIWMFPSPSLYWAAEEGDAEPDAAMRFASNFGAEQAVRDMAAAITTLASARTEERPVRNVCNRIRPL